MEVSIAHFEHSFNRFSKTEAKRLELESTHSEEEKNIARTPWLYLGGWQRTVLFTWLALGLMIVAGVFAAVYVTSLNTRQERLENKCDAWAASIEKIFKESRSHVISYKAMLNLWDYRQTPSQLNQDKFLEYSLLTKTTRPLVIGVAYLSRVLNENRIAFEKNQNWTILNYYLQPQGNRSEYAPVTYSDLKFPVIAHVDSWAGENEIA